MTEMDSAPHDKQELQFTLDLIEGAIISGDYLEALQMAEKALSKADEQHWVDIFEGVIERITNLQKEQVENILNQNESKSSEIEVRPVKTLSVSSDDFTLLPGVGSAMALKLHEAGFHSFSQLAQTIPEKLSRVKGVGTSSAIKIISSANKQKAPSDGAISVQNRLQVNTSGINNKDEDSIEQQVPIIEDKEAKSSEVLEIKESKIGSRKILENQVLKRKLEIEKSKSIDQKEGYIIPLIPAIFKEHEYSLLQKKVKIQGIDGIACKFSIISPLKQLIVLIPYKIHSSPEKLIISETETRFYGANSNSTSLSIDSSLRNAVEILNEKLAENAENNSLLILLSSIIEEEISLQNTAIRIEPILISIKTPGFTEKSIPFAYQRQNKVHFISKSQLPSFLEFIERKVYYIESYALSHREASASEVSKIQFIRNIHRISYPFMGFGAIYALIIGMGLHFLLKYFIIIGYASFSVYLCGLVILWWRYRSQEIERMTKHKSTQYPLRLEFEEGDLIMIHEELSLNQMAQFIYECFGKNIPFKIIERIEKAQMENMNIPSSLNHPSVKPQQNSQNYNVVHKNEALNNEEGVKIPETSPHDANVPVPEEKIPKSKSVNTSMSKDIKEENENDMDLVRKYSVYLND